MHGSLLGTRPRASIRARTMSLTFAVGVSCGLAPLMVYAPLAMTPDRSVRNESGAKARWIS